eukprot:CAMPEP_0172654232 /NCGR_PEP_ID=MMETSP1068-20121228/244228_1 /TAXON_ID=35684 /ORGANISM="Pseudopedinella elastica, Strain CCMP716" /LENGTH=258 /DNA_ID=CAMNT_0013468673 /DNA_START=583 /DNA_END=1359 /DNA_ORIENTATION=-
MTIKYLKMHDTVESYGAERLYGAYGWAVSSLVLGALSDVSPGGLISATYPLLSINMILFLVAISRYGLEQRHSEMSRYLSVEPKGVGADIENSTPVENSTLGASKPQSVSSVIWAAAVDLGRLSQSFFGGPSRCGFMLAAVAMAAGTSIVEKLLFLFFREDLGASYLVCGLSVVVTVVFEIPIFAYAKPVLDQCGPAALMVVAATAYTTRVVGYTLVPNGWLVRVHLSLSYFGIAMRIYLTVKRANSNNICDLECLLE